MWVHNQIHSKSITPSWGQAACVCLLIVAQCALANPTGAKVTYGNASVLKSGSTTTITQTTNKAIINWQDFSINPNEITQFKQPSAQSFTLNRVVGGNASQILGALKSNGNIYLINPNGILFGKGARVDVGGLVASTSSISDRDFLNSRTQKFTQSPSGASIINHGNITVRNAGLAVLVSPHVINDGVIAADLGTVAIASADHFTLDLYGDNLINLDAGSTLKQSGLVENLGTIQANGGKVYITAQAADKLLENVVNMEGMVQAETVGKHQGKIVLRGYDNSMMNIMGSINLSGDLGGMLKVSADNINLANSSVINASGVNGGGTVNIGGEYQGGGTLRHAQNVTMNPGAIIHADALQNGNGGTITLWSDRNTLAYGTLTAKGGAQSGHGGLIETSSHTTLDTANITVDASAAHGAGGLWYSDPITLTITDGIATGYNTSLAGGTDVMVTTSDGIEFNNTGVNIDWNTGANFSVRSNSAANSIATDPSTITYNGGCTSNVTCQVISNGSGNVDFFYNPTDYTTPTDFSSYVKMNGSGTFIPYMDVNTNAELALINNNLAGNYALNTNLSSIGAFTSIGGQGTGFNFTGIFTGSIQGNQYTISGYNIAGGAFGNVGLFGSVVGGTLKDITVDNVTVAGAGEIGGIAGYVMNANLIGSFNVLATTASTITSSGALAANAGGVFGELVDVNSQANMTNYATVTGRENSGGIVGGLQTTASTLSGSLSNYGNVSASLFNAGGIIGLNDASVISGNLIVGDGITPITIGGTGQGIGNIIGNQELAGADLTSLSVQVASNVTLGGAGVVGGIIGALGAGATFTGLSSVGAVYNIPTVSNASADYVGGVIGAIYDGQSLSSNLFAIADVVGRDNVGGVIGGSVDFFTSTPNTITGSLSNTGFSVTGQNAVGGIIGSAGVVTLNGTMTGSATVVSTGTGAGGLIGNISGSDTVIGSNAVLTTTGGSVSGVASVGGLIGVLSPTTYSSSNLNPFSNAASVIGTGNGIGGIYGSGTMSGATINNDLSNSGNVTGLSSTTGVGGITGTINNVLITGNLTNTGSISGADQVGGLFGLVTNGSLLFTGTLQTSTGTISGGNKVGGLFGEFNGSSISSPVTFNSGTVTGTGAEVGGIAGLITNTSTVGASSTLSVLSGSVSGASQVGGFFGQIDAGNNWFASNDFANYASVTGGTDTGGFAGNVNNNFTQNLSNHGTINGAANTGGLFGTYAGTFTGILSNDASVTGTNSVGGIVGSNNGALSQAQVTSGTITGTSQVGGIAGSNTGTIDQSVVLSSVSISATGTDIGGIIGHNTNTVTNVSFSGDLSAAGANNVGGLIGLNDGTIQYGLMVGSVTGGTNVGALVGNNAATGNLLNSIYNADLNSGLDGTGVNTGTITSILAGSSASLYTFTPYTNLGFNAAIWQLVTGNYASLIWCGSACYTTEPYTPPSPSPTIPTNVIQVIQTQIVNNENGFKAEPTLNVSVALVLSYASALLDQMNFSNDPQGQMASWFITNSIILQIGDMVQGTGDTDPIVVMHEVVTALQKAQGCAVN